MPLTLHLRSAGNNHSCPHKGWSHLSENGTSFTESLAAFDMIWRLKMLEAGKLPYLINRP